MFESELRSADDAAVVAAIEQWASAEASAAARRLAAVAELARRRCGDDERDQWACDTWDAAAAEVSAALHISHRQACGQMRIGLALRQRFPRIAALFADGLLSYRIVSAITWRTTLVFDDDALAAIDAAIADHAGKWGPLSDFKLEQAIDKWIDRFDPGALRRSRIRSRSRDVKIGDRDDESGTSSLFGRLLVSDAAILERRLKQMARGLCDDDPRTMGQRRADALGALAAGAELACQCGSPTCPVGGDGRQASPVVIHVLADEAALLSNPDPHFSGETANCRWTPGMSLVDYLTPDPEPDPTGPASMSVILGGGAVPAPLLAEMIRAGAKVRHVQRPADEPEPGYRPSTALAEFVRMRDLTCRFPNCDVPAEFCDIDHSVAWPLGPTHASNLNAKCRKHHLLKTFWTGKAGWSEVQLPDGRIVMTSPAGKVYTTVPGSWALFPDWNTTTADVMSSYKPPQSVEPPQPVDPQGRGLQMPRRKRRRVIEEACRIRAERALNDAYVAERNKPPPY